MTRSTAPRASRLDSVILAMVLVECVPTYEYQCDNCQRTFEIRQRITEPPLTRCDACGGTVRRLLSPAPFILKGEGWYVTDYPSEARKKAKSTESGSPSTSETAAKPGGAAGESSASTSSSKQADSAAGPAPAKAGGETKEATKSSSPSTTKTDS